MDKLDRMYSQRWICRCQPKWGGKLLLPTWKRLETRGPNIPFNLVEDVLTKMWIRVTNGGIIKGLMTNFRGEGLYPSNMVMIQ
jgi:hypothetical protein